MKRIMFFGVVVVIAVFAALGIFLLRQPDTYSTTVTVEKPFNKVWKWVADPKTYPRIYPNWVKAITQSTPTTFSVSDQFGGSYDMHLVANQDNGTVDLLIGDEKSSLKVTAQGSDKTSLTHSAKRWSGANPVIWFFHKRTTDRDFQNAKNVIEAEP